MIGIYCIENTVNGKKYIGQSIDVDVRFKEHKGALRSNRHSNSHLQNAWNKYGEDSFRFFVIQQCTEADSDDLEIYYIKTYKTSVDENGYNLELGGMRKNKRLSEESKRKCGIANIGNKYCLGRVLSEKEKKRLASLQLGTKQSELTIQKRVIKLRGQKRSPEAKMRISRSKIGKIPKGLIGNKYSLGHKHSDETKHKMSNWHRGKTKSEETRKRMSEASKRRWDVLAEDVKERILDRLRHPVITEETRKKMSESAKRRKKNRLAK